MVSRDGELLRGMVLGVTDSVAQSLTLTTDSFRLSHRVTSARELNRFRMLGRLLLIRLVGTVHPTYRYR